ncbi:hypothetical protein GCM10009839_54200 [Catenulispora yoronensis]|uniref:Uncharacterized protein n=2 Tax=Catenulispora yoronensis TaxID=450799 RepID=A0ABN2UVV4_9ACTN
MRVARSGVTLNDMTSTAPAASAWTPDELRLLANHESLVLTVGPTGGDGPTLGVGSTFGVGPTLGAEARESVEIGMVLVDAQLFVRAYRGTGSRWYQAARKFGRGQIRVGETTRDVVLHTSGSGLGEEPDPDAATGQAVDAAFVAKYGAAAAGLVASAPAREATILITAWTPSKHR